MTDTTTANTKLVERRMPRAGILGFLGLTGVEAGAMVIVGFGLTLVALSRTDVSTMIACAVGLALDAGLFLVPIGKDRAIHLAPRYARFARAYFARQIDVHARVVEGRRYTHRTLGDDLPLSTHLGAVWLSTFTWASPTGPRQAGLLIEGGSRWRPWRAAHMVVVQLSGQDQLLLESADYQETLLRRWTTFLNTMSKKNLGLTGAQELLLSRPVIQGEGAHWRGFNPLLDHQPIKELADRYRAIQLAHDATDTDRRIYLVLRSGGTLGSWFKARHHGSSRAGVEEHFGSVLTKLGGMAKTATLTMVAALTAEQIAAEFRLMVDPASAPAVGYRRGSDREVGTVPFQVAPIIQWNDKHTSHVEVNGMVAATYRTVGWPDTVVGTSLLDAALTDHPSILRISVPFSPPANPKVARRLNLFGKTNAQAKAETKAAKGVVQGEDEKMVDEGHAQRDTEQARGKHHPAFYTAYYTLVADDLEALHRAADDLATQLDTVGVDIQNCHAFQAEAYAYVAAVPGAV